MKKLLIFIFISLSQCSLLAEGEEIIYLHAGSSYLPIYIRGNVNSDTYILWVHGGPGSSGLYYGDMEEVAQLHKKYRIVYYDQMGSGGSIGTPDKTEYTIDTFTEHLQSVVNIIKNRYQPKNLFLLGHSWGGFLSSYYFVAKGDTSLSAQRQTLFNGFINLNAVMDIPDTITNGISFVTNYAQSQIDQNKDPKCWAKMIKWYQDKNNNFTGSDVTQHYNNVDDVGGMVIQKARRNQIVKELSMKMVFNSPFEFFSYYENQKGIRNYLDIQNESVARLSEPNVSLITIPTLILAGADDRIAFPNSVTNWHSLLSSSDKPLKMYNNSAHAVFIDNKDDYIIDIDDFISRNKR